MADELSRLTNEELRQRLRLFNLPDGPITPTTRKTFERKLQRALQSDARVDEPDCIRQHVINDRSPSTFNSADRTVETTEILPCLHPDSQSEIDNIFYGVFLPVDEETAAKPQTPLVYTDKTEALLSVKKNSGARFKAFNSRNEAEAFAFGKPTTPTRQVSPVVHSKPEDLTGNYKAPKPEEIARFRKLIEGGELNGLMELINKNPKYFISSGDTPVILQEGFRYNAMHVAAKAGKKDVCQFILSTLESDDFWKLLYPTDEKNLKDQHVNSRRRRFVLDLYLNTPDKGCCETPLHFACKFGKADVVEYLLSRPETDKVFLNKYAETAYQVICNRIPNCPEELRSRIQNMFTMEDTLYVPILRSDDNCLLPKVGTPWSQNLGGKPDDIIDCGSPGEPRYRISAYAGPMSPREADNFCYALKSPRATPENRTKFRNIKRSDDEKGLERIARKLARAQSVTWCEYWKFLDCFTDLSTTDGLTKLEEYLQAKKEMYVSNMEKWKIHRTPDSGKRILDGSYHGARLDSDDRVFEQEERTLQPDHEDRNYLQTPTGRNHNIKGFRIRLKWDELPDSDLASNDLFVRKKLNNSNPSSSSDFGGVSGQTVYENKLSSRNDEFSALKRLEGPQNLSEEKKPKKSEREEKYHGLSSPDNLDFDGHGSSMDTSNCSLKSSQDSLLGLSSEFEQLRLKDTPSPKEKSKPATNRVDASSINNCPFTGSRISSETTSVSMTSENKDIQVFIEGLRPSKVDLDVLRAVKSAKIDPANFPNVCRWQKAVRSFSKATRDAWPGPGSPRFHRTRRKIWNTWSC